MLPFEALISAFTFLFFLAHAVGKHKEWGPAWPNILDEGCTPTLMNGTRTKNDDAWVRSQVMFWYGDLYPLVIKGSWPHIRLMLVKSTHHRKSSVLSISDTSEEAVIARYGAEGTYRHWHDAYMLCDFLRHSPALQQFDNQHGFPVLMQDGVLANVVAITFARLISPGKEVAVLWPWPYHLHLAREGLSDESSFLDKIPKVVFRGAYSGPLRHVNNFHSRVKSSRLSIIFRWRNHTWADFGISSVPDDKIPFIERDSEIKNQLAIMTRSAESIGWLLRHRYILVMEGADISSSFGWVLASRSVPFHPYPFTFHVWFYNGLQPWVHFVPLLPDGSDLEDAFNWCEENAAACDSIAEAGRVHMFRMLDANNLTAVKQKVVGLWNLRM